MISAGCSSKTYPLMPSPSLPRVDKRGQGGRGGAHRVVAGGEHGGLGSRRVSCMLVHIIYIYIYTRVLNNGQKIHA